MAGDNQTSGDDEPEPVELPVDGVLDLHMFRPSEAKALIHDYIDLCREKGIYDLRIIHGKGTGALRELVHAQLRKRTDIADFGLAGGDAGSWGATRVRLRC